MLLFLNVNKLFFSDTLSLIFKDLCYINRSENAFYSNQTNTREEEKSKAQIKDSYQENLKVSISIQINSFFFSLFIYYILIIILKFILVNL